MFTLFCRSNCWSLKKIVLFVVCVVCVYVVIYVNAADYVLINPIRKRYISTLYLNLIPNRFLEAEATSKFPTRRVHDIDCAAIFANDRHEIAKARNISTFENFTRKSISDEEYFKLTENCDIFKLKRGYYNYNLKLEEEEFPIAYSILLYKDVEQAERLLKAIYRPQNVYCLHVDADSHGQVHIAVDHVAKCFNNVFVVTRKEYVVYEGLSRLQADLNCMENLLQGGREWNYFINLPSQQFPIKTNAEIVKILKVHEQLIGF